MDAREIVKDVFVGMAKGILTKAKNIEWVTCKHCGSSEDVVLFGRSREGKQRYWCKKCKRAF